MAAFVSPRAQQIEHLLLPVCETAETARRRSARQRSEHRGPIEPPKMACPDTTELIAPTISAGVDSLSK